MPISQDNFKNASPAYRQIKISVILNHPNICTIYEVDEVEGRAFIAMERGVRFRQGVVQFAEALFDHRAFCARLIFLRADADRVRLPLGLVLEPLRVVRALIAASMRLRSSWSSLTIPSIDMGGNCSMVWFQT
jgi:hypothetical protein